MASGFNINKAGIREFTRSIQRELDRNPVSVSITGSGDRQSADTPGSAVDCVSCILLEWAGSDSSRQSKSVNGLLAENPDHPLAATIAEYGDAAVHALGDGDLLNVHSSFQQTLSEATFWITDSGTTALARLRERRENQLARTRGSRDGVLHWAYNVRGGATNLEGILTTPFGWHLGRPFTMDELESSWHFLADEGLVEGTPNSSTITSTGVQAIEQYGDVMSYQNRPKDALSVVFTGDNNGQLAIGNRDVQQTATTTQNDSQVLAIYAQALREFASLMSDPEGATELNSVADSLDRESSKADPDKTWIKSLLQRAGAMLGRTQELKNLAELTRVGLEVYNATQP